MLVILAPDFEGTNSLLMKRPVGCVYFTPLGAIKSIDKSDILQLMTLSVSNVKRNEYYSTRHKIVMFTEGCGAVCRGNVSG